MAQRKMMPSYKAIVEAAIEAGCEFCAGYPLTPATEILEYANSAMPKVGRVSLQVESEIAAINMCYGAASTGKRSMTASSGLGFSLMQDCMSQIAGANVPVVVIEMMRGGPGLGDLGTTQADYFQAVKGGGHGDYRCIVLAPANVQEAIDTTRLAFHLADKYRNPAIVLGDQLLAKTTESVVWTEWIEPPLPEKTWALTGAQGRHRSVISTSLPPERSQTPSGQGFEMQELRLLERQRKYDEICVNEVRCEEYRCDDAEVVICAYGSMGRIARSAVNAARAEGLKVGLFRPITLWPFPEQQLTRLAERVSAFLTVEMSFGQFVEDVRLAVNGRRPVHFFCRVGGIIPSIQEITREVRTIASNQKVVSV